MILDKGMTMGCHGQGEDDSCLWTGQGRATAEVDDHLAT